jgi:hypothetical protein
VLSIRRMSRWPSTSALKCFPSNSTRRKEGISNTSPSAEDSSRRIECCRDNVIEYIIFLSETVFFFLFVLRLHGRNSTILCTEGVKWMIFTQGAVCSPRFLQNTEGKNHSPPRSIYVLFFFTTSLRKRHYLLLNRTQK